MPNLPNPTEIELVNQAGLRLTLNNEIGLQNSGPTFAAVREQIQRLNLIDLCKTIVNPQTNQQKLEQTKTTLKLIFARILRDNRYRVSEDQVESRASLLVEYNSEHPTQNRIKTFNVYYYVDLDSIDQRAIRNMVTEIQQEFQLTQISYANDNIDFAQNQILHTNEVISSRTLISTPYSYYSTTDNTLNMNGQSIIHIQVYDWKFKTGFENFINHCQNDEIPIFAFGANVPSRFKLQVKMEVTAAARIYNANILEGEPMVSDDYYSSQRESLHSIMHVASSFYNVIDNERRAPETYARFSLAITTVKQKLLQLLPLEEQNSVDNNEKLLNFVLRCSIFASQIGSHFENYYQEFRQVCNDIIHDSNSSAKAKKVAYMVFQSICRVSGISYLPPISAINPILSNFTNQYSRNVADSLGVGSLINLSSALQQEFAASESTRERYRQEATRLVLEVSSLTFISQSRRDDVRFALMNLFDNTINNPAEQLGHIRIPITLERNYSKISYYLLSTFLATNDIQRAKVMYIMMQALQKRMRLSPLIPFENLIEMSRAGTVVNL